MHGVMVIVIDGYTIDARQPWKFTIVGSVERGAPWGAIIPSLHRGI